MYSKQLAIEATVVGATTAGAYMIVRNIVPGFSTPVQMFITGALIHLSFEAAGANKWYLRHGAATLR
jgi:hypothetical protein